MSSDFASAVCNDLQAYNISAAHDRRGKGFDRKRINLQRDGLPEVIFAIAILQNVDHDRQMINLPDGHQPRTQRRHFTGLDRLRHPLARAQSAIQSGAAKPAIEI